MRHLFFSLAVCLLISCQSNLPYQKFLKESNLPTTSFIVNNSRDTVLYTEGGVSIRIEGGSFNKEKVKLKVKEALTMENIVRAGLTTASNGKPLSSGGMVQIVSPDNGVAFRKAIEISIVTKDFDAEMKVFKGETQDGVINWEEPQALKDSISPWLQMGQQIFNGNCASCHQLNKNLSGPALVGVEERGPWTDRSQLFCFIKNPAAYIPTNVYTQDLQKQYGQIMPGFPALGRTDLHAIFDYIKSGGDIYSKSFSRYQRSEYDISCDRHDSLRLLYNELLFELAPRDEEQKPSRINWQTDFGFPDSAANSNDAEPISLPSTNDDALSVSTDMVVPKQYEAKSYRFDIASFGWYNVDRLYQATKEQAKLSVSLNGEHRDELNVFIVIPQYKVFYEGGEMQGQSHKFAFHTSDGLLPLPIGTDVTVFAIGEADGKIVFDWRRFISSAEQDIQLNPITLEETQFNDIMSRIVPKGVDVAAMKLPPASDTSGREGKRKQLAEITNLLGNGGRSHCECNYARVSPVVDTIVNRHLNER